MSRPIHEPADNRVLANHEYRTQQLERRPALSPDGGLVATVRMMRDLAFACPGTGVYRNPFLHSSEDAGTEIERGQVPSLPHWDLVEDPSPSPSEWAIQIYEPGIYAVRHHTAWSGGTFFRVTRVQYGVKQARAGWAEGRHPISWADVAVGTLSWLGLFDICIITQEDIDTAGSANLIYPQVAQTSGAPVDVTGEFQFWGPVAFEGEYTVGP